MNRAPGFMLYAQKAIAGSLHLSGDSFKAYWLMLFWMWANSKDYCSMPDTDTAWHRATMVDDPVKLAEVQAEIMNPEFPMLKKVRQKMVSNGLKKEAEKHKNQRRKASIAGRASAKARRDKALDAERALNERCSGVQLKSNNTVTVTVTDTTKKKEPSPQAVRLTHLFLDSIRETRPDFREPNLKKWTADADKMLRLDNREVSEATQIIMWVHGNKELGTEPHMSPVGKFGWSLNILSIAKFREQYDQLKGQWAAEQVKVHDATTKAEYAAEREGKAKFNATPCVVCGEPLGEDIGYTHANGGSAHSTQGPDGCYMAEAKFNADGSAIEGAE